MGLAEALRQQLRRTEDAEVGLIETHLSWVLLTPRHAYKLKKPVQLGFVDFSTLPARQHACEEELRLNRRMAASLYLAVLPVRGPPQAPRLSGSGAPIDWVVKMRRFPDGALWSERLAAGRLGAAHVDAFAQRLAAFHAAAPVAHAGAGFGDAPLVADTVQQVYTRLEAIRPGAAGEALGGWLAAQSTALAPVWQARLQDGFVRECHGDLHLANVVVLERAGADDEVSAFDCLEFDPALRWIDVLSDTAFLVMDLWAHGRHDLAFRFLDTYLAHSGDHAGLPVLRHYMVYRALVRGLVSLLQGRERHATTYLDLARTLATGTDPRLLITHGLPGSGKTHVSQGLLEAAGAIRLRSDVERKRLHGLAAFDDSHAQGLDIYTAAATERTFTHLHDLAAVALQAGYPVVVDAAFLKRAERDRFRGLARARGVPFTLLACQAPPEMLRERVQSRAARGDDASEAGVAVLDTLMRTQEPLQDDERRHTIEVDTTHALDPAGLAARWQEVLP
ncbi:MAG: AAA family ATPase [Rhizobacter sp.]|nr:AAA family ATPase [Rhizobacter sp.]